MVMDIESNSIEELFGIRYAGTEIGGFFPVLHFTVRRYLKITTISDKHQYRIPNTHTT